MIGSAIREMSAARTVPLISAAFFEGHVQIWNLDSQRMEGEFPVRKNGSMNLTMHPDGEFIVAGFSAKRGSVMAHATPDGAIMWRRDKIEEGGFLRFDRSGLRVSFPRGRRESVERLDARSGVTVELLEHTGRYVDGPNDYALLASSSGPNYLVVRRDDKVSVPKLTFAILDAAFSSATVCITESGGPVRCVDCVTGAELWRYTPPDGSHALRLHYNCVDGFFFGVVWHYDRGQFRYLVRFDAETGQAIIVCSLDSWEEVFYEAAQQVVTSSGGIINLSSGEMVGELAFPLKEYPDRFTVENL
jgi:hypothetical protein